MRRFFASTIIKNLYVVSIEEGTPINAAYDTPFGSLTLEATLTATLNDTSTVEIPITWNSATYTQDAPGDQIVQGAMTLPPGVTNPFAVIPITHVIVNELFSEQLFIVVGFQTFAVPDGVEELFYIRGAGGGATGGSLALVGSSSGGGGGAFAQANTIAATSSEVHGIYVAPQVDGPLPAGTDLDGLDGNISFFTAATPAGSTIISGAGVPGGGTGSDGNYYADTLTGELYGPKASGSWPGSPAPALLRAAGGKKGIPSGAGGLGGVAADCIGDVFFDGGDGSTNAASRSGGGGGGASSSGAGGDATIVSGTSVLGGTGAAGTNSDPNGGNGGGGTTSTPLTGLEYSGGGSGCRNTSIQNRRAGNGKNGWMRTGYFGSTVPPPEPGNSYSILLAGQSNMKNSNPAQDPGVPYEGPLDANIWVNSATGYQPIEQGVNYVAGNLGQFGPGLSIGYTLGLLAPGEIDIIDGAIGGTAIRTQWNPLVNGAGRTSVSSWRTAMNYRDDQGKFIFPKAICFRQGEYEMNAALNPMNVDTGVITIHVNTIPPVSGDGANGDLWIDKTGKRVYGPKAAGATPWQYNPILIYSGSLLSGSGAPSGGTGANGDSYYDETNKTWYGPKASGAWPASVPFKNFAIQQDWLYYASLYFMYAIDQLIIGGFDTTDLNIIISRMDTAFGYGNEFAAEITAAQIDLAANFKTYNPSYAALCGTLSSFSTDTAAGYAVYDGQHFDGSSQIQHGLDFAAAITIP